MKNCLLRFLSGLSFICLAAGCDNVWPGLHEFDRQVNSAWGLRPVYASSVRSDAVTLTAPRPFVKTGAFVVFGNLLLIVDEAIGLHVLDNADPKNPVRVGFIELPGVTSVTVSGDFAYANSYLDLLAIDLAGLPNSIEVTDRENDFFDPLPDYPEGYVGYFECVDASRGVLVGWESDMLDNPQCLNPN